MKKIFSLVIALTTMASMAFAAALEVDCGTQVQITASAKTGYHFVEWNDHNTDNPRTVDATADVTYTAYFEINSYTIRFLNDGGAELQSEVLTHGSPVSYKGSTPTKASTAEWDYTFAGWTPTINPTATADADYTAVYDATKRKYVIKFVNWDGTELQSSEWEYGTTPTYLGATPTRPTYMGVTYTFSGWDMTISTVTGTATYTVQYSTGSESYTITVVSDDDAMGTVSGGGIFAYNGTATITATAKECYRFVRWSDGNTNASRDVTVTGAATYTAYFEKIRYTITVVSNDEGMGTVSVSPAP
ncbi:MAG: hypothetical protein IJ204_07360 [Paludibacteraceae bacterium]|nr:hypothetical protein [Paludibacteraceae bacterium]